MCEYSLESVARRNARLGDQLRTEKIGSYGSVGLVAPNAPQTAVCLRPGTKLIVSGIPARLQKAWNVEAVVVATFEQRGAAARLMRLLSRAGRYRDGVRFDAEDHRFVLFQDFPVSVGLSVEMIPAVCQVTIQGDDKVRWERELIFE
jgi:hypothetical protein